MFNNKDMDISQQHKEEIERKIIESIIVNLEENKLPQEELPIIADFVLGKIDTVKNHDELVIFLTELSTKWPIFTNITSIEKGEVKEKVEDKVAEDVLNLAKSGKIDEAIGLAKTMTES